jgi:uncharacterized membrane protein
VDVVVSDDNNITIRQLILDILLERAKGEVLKEVISITEIILLVTEQESTLKIVRIRLGVNLNLDLLRSIATTVTCSIQPRILIDYISINSVIENLRIVCRLIKGTINS